MKNTRFLKAGLVVMVLLNIITIAFLWMGNPSHGEGPRGPHGPHDDGPFQFLCDRLHLDSKQVTDYEKLRDEHHNAIEKYQDHSHELRNRFFALLQSANADSATIKQYADSIAMDQQQIELITFYHFKKLRAICTPEQQKTFDEVIGDALKMMSGPQHGPPPPPR
jgi:protein CpxP